jgi:hypothetical protein
LKQKTISSSVKLGDMSPGGTKFYVGFNTKIFKNFV